MFQLRPYQELLIEGVRDEFRSGRRKTCIVAPCGAGKTVIMAWMAAQTATKGNNVLFAVHRQELIEQSSNTFAAMGIQHGIIAPGCIATGDQIQIGSIFTIARRLDKIQPPNLIIFDEAHHCKANTWIKLIQAFPNAYVIGLTATPARTNGDGLGDIFNSLVLGPSVKQLIEWGNLSPYKYFAPPVKANLDGLRVKYGDYVKSDITLAMDRSEIIGDAIEQYKKLADGKRAIAYCVSRAHSEHTAEMFRAAGIPAQHIDGETDHGVRKAAIEQFRTGQIKVLCNVDLISEGFDVPAMEAVLLLRPTQSLTLHIQQSMRPMRPDKDNPGKVAIIIDHVGNCYRHGLPDEDRVWSLEGRKKSSTGHREISLRQCPKCYAAHRPAPVCPLCGYQYAPTERAEPEQKKGELVKIDEIERQRRKQEIRQAKNITDLEQIALRRGYKLGWINKMAELKRIKR
ncbi:DEAD/DEAH box helicase [Desulforamulus hydrothermalis]|uniref:Type III restriction enzyme, res subunit n=1 Tax=Desulforamulus hydrothermalis Lam5 = DSM 18033 TaxID=1121428 RepID=K8EHZ7_9FIRM|nr:DEAD/DEAH box helicase [Desulforamulus hydrothermalis]CCO08251.1 Type III restriction enzyme, res subunit [Desulforamulus hydrothermalis Lam5 = DSM 18033]SHH43726.1 Helicase conserved C-terminal domain-containing protein [Desulforamulus hydrothermalis Lam5 = DSM 18033]